MAGDGRYVPSLLLSFLKFGALPGPVPPVGAGNALNQESPSSSVDNGLTSIRNYPSNSELRCPVPFFKNPQNSRGRTRFISVDRCESGILFSVGNCRNLLSACVRGISSLALIYIYTTRARAERGLFWPPFFPFAAAADGSGGGLCSSESDGHRTRFVLCGSLSACCCRRCGGGDGGGPVICRKGESAHNIE